MEATRNEAVKRSVVGAAASLATLAALTAAMIPLRSHLSIATAGLVLVVPVLVGVTWGGFGAGVVAVTACFLAYDFFFIPPYGTLSVGASQNWVALGVYAAVMLPVATVVARLNAAQAEATRKGQDLADQQETLRRVAGLVTTGAPPEAVFTALAAEAGRFFEADFAVMSRYEADGTAVVVGEWANSDVDHPHPVGTRLTQGGTNVHTLVYRSRQASRVDDNGDERVGASVTRQSGVRSVVGVPIQISGRLWGMIAVASRRGVLPATAGAWLAGFTELVAAAVASAQAQVELRAHGEEEAALHRVAALVARAANPEEVFGAVAREIGLLFDVDFAVLSRYEPDDDAVVVGNWTNGGLRDLIAVGTRLAMGGRNIHSQVLASGQSVRIEDLHNTSGPSAEIGRALKLESGIGAPINVEGRLWGVIIVASGRPEPLAADIEYRLAAFTELVATAVANAHAHSQLIASRARIVAAADDTRRRIERDLHDGAQQRLVSLALQLRSAQSAARREVPEIVGLLEDIARGLDGVMEQLLEIARGIHPGALAAGGLRPALKTLARRCGLPIELEVDVDGRLTERTELAAYYAVAEALTNAAKHASATVVDVRVGVNSRVLQVRVSDDGIGGADIRGGSGLEGLTDRIGALGGRLSLSSPPGGGTTLDISLPIDT